VAQIFLTDMPNPNGNNQYGDKHCMPQFYVFEVKKTDTAVDPTDGEFHVTVCAREK
jgi:hypothetical protein